MTLRANEKPLSEMDIVKIVYKDISPNLWPAAAINVHQHLGKLIKENKIILIAGDENLYQFRNGSNL